ncbi:hypothetical protein D3C78_1538340 [compost metagenome]
MAVTASEKIPKLYPKIRHFLLVFPKYLSTTKPIAKPQKDTKIKNKRITAYIETAGMPPTSAGSFGFSGTPVVAFHKHSEAAVQVRNAVILWTKSDDLMTTSLIKPKSKANHKREPVSRSYPSNRAVPGLLGPTFCS